jgi:uncharacterized membrane protein
LAEYLENQGTIAVAFFGFNYILISIAAFSICQYAYKRHLIDEDDRAFYAAYKQTYFLSIVYTIIAFFLCFVSIVIPIVMYLFLFTFFAAPKVFAKKIYQRKVGRKGIN